MGAVSDFESLAGAEGSHIVLGVLVAFAVYQVKAIMTRALQLQEQLSAMGKRVDDIESGRLIQMADRLTEIQDRITQLHPHGPTVPVPDVQQDQV